MAQVGCKDNNKYFGGLILMDVRHSHHYEDVKKYDTETLRRHFLIENIFKPNECTMTYSHYDRIIVVGIMPVSKKVELSGSDELRTDYFLERRELGLINIGGNGIVTADGQKFEINTSEGMYIGRGVKDIYFESIDPKNPAKFYINSGPAHTSFHTKKIGIEEVAKVNLGTDEECNKRTIYQYVHPQVLESCQLVMGMTVLEPGNIWNTMPAHTHDRRMEVYLYFDMDDENVVFHLMGQPQETRHIVVRNEEAVISPSWSIHSGVGTKNYTFIWGMVGENQTFTDMDGIKKVDLR